MANRAERRTPVANRFIQALAKGLLHRARANFAAPSSVFPRVCHSHGRPSSWPCWSTGRRVDPGATSRISSREGPRAEPARRGLRPGGKWRPKPKGVISISLSCEGRGIVQALCIFGRETHDQFRAEMNYAPSRFGVVAGGYRPWSVRLQLPGAPTCFLLARFRGERIRSFSRSSTGPAGQFRSTQPHSRARSRAHGPADDRDQVGRGKSPKRIETRNERD